MKTTLIANCLTLSAALGASSLALAAEPLVFTLDDPRTGVTLARGEESTAHQRDAIEVTSRYLSPDGKPLLIESYSVSPHDAKLLHLRQDTLTTGDSLEVTIADRRAQVSERAANGTVETTTVDWGANHTVGPLLGRGVLQGWEALQRGDTLKFELFVPQMARAFSYCADLKKQTIEVQPCNLMLRPFAPSLNFEVATSNGSPTILSYEGPGPLEIDGVAHRRVRISFHQLRAQEATSKPAREQARQ